MIAERAGDLLHWFDAGSHGLAAPLVEELAGGRLSKLRFLMTDNSSGRKRHLIPNPELPDEPHESNPEAHAGTNQAQHLGTAQCGDARLIQAGKQR